MKKIIIILAALIFTFTSCEKHDSYDEDRPTIVGFVGLVQGQSTTVNLPDGGTLSRDIKVFVSDVSSEDRNFEVMVESDINSENFSYATTATVPANTREAVFNVEFTDISVPTEFTLATFLFSNEDPNYVSGGKTTFNIKSAE